MERTVWDPILCCPFFYSRMDQFMKKILFFLGILPLALSAKKNKVGGQAIIEGVMMRGKQKVSWAVRKPDGSMVIESFPFTSVCRKYKILKTPVIRGAINLYESMVLGFKSLMRSAEIAMPEEEKPKEKNFKETFAMVMSMVVAFAVAIGLFMFLPMVIANIFFEKSALSFNFVAGIIRISLIVLYMFSISFWKDIQRVFEYHGAEHKAIFTFEDDKELTLENMRPYTTLHPRCGTSFLLLVGLVCILLFSIIDTLFIHYIGQYPNVLSRVFVHILLIPLVGGCSYEVLRLSDRYQHIFPVSLLIKPGLWLQLITTREPDDKQLETASAALKAAL
jgi:uncharacterized protein YqhQ